MTLLQIKYLIAVVETGNVSKAASDLFVSRPTISRALKELEDEFGVTLFFRTNSGLSLTDEGRFFYEKCLTLHRKSEVLELQMHSIREKMLPTASRTVKLCITPAVSITIFPRLYKELQKKFPDINVVTMEYGQQQARTALDDGTIDFHLTSDVRWGMMPASFRVLDLQENDFVLYMSVNHPLASRKYLTVDDIKDEPIVCFDKYYYYEAYLEKLYVEKKLSPKIVFRSFQLSAIREMVAAGVGCTAMMRGPLNDGKAITCVPIMPKRVWTTALVWNSAVPHNTACDDFLKFMHDFKDQLDAEAAGQANTEKNI